MPTPGVYVNTSVRGGAAGGVTAPSGQFFVVGQFERGPVDRAVKIRNLSEFIQYYGGDTSYSDGYLQLSTFFAEGGRQAIISRVVGTAASRGSVTLKDRNSTPADLLKIEASSPGAWSSNLSVQVSAGPTSTTFRITVRLNGQIVEDYNSLATAQDAVEALTTSLYVSASVVPGNTTPSPNNIPAVVSATNLTAGSDDRASLNAEMYISGLGLFDTAFGDGTVSIPGQTSAAVYTALVNHAKENNRIALLAAPQTATVSTLQTTAASVNSEFAGLFAPWVQASTSAGVRSISPEGYVAGVRARAHEQIGPWRQPAGEFAKANFLVGLDSVYSRPDFDTLYQSKVNVIRGESNNIRLYGWRSLSNDQNNWYSLKDRDIVNRITVEATNRLEQFVFSPIDARGLLLAEVEAELVSVVAPISLANGLFGTYDDNGDEIDPGYAVSVSAVNNTTVSLANNEIHADLAVRVSPNSDLIYLNIIKVGLLESVL